MNRPPAITVRQCDLIQFCKTDNDCWYIDLSRLFAEAFEEFRPLFAKYETVVGVDVDRRTVTCRTPGEDVDGWWELLTELLRMYFRLRMEEELGNLPKSSCARA